MSKYQNRISERLCFKIALKDCISILNTHITPSGKMSDKEALSELYGILDNKNMVNNLKQSDWSDERELEAFYKWRSENGDVG